MRRLLSTCTGDKPQKSSGGGEDSKEQKGSGEEPKEDGKKENGAGGKDAGEKGEDGRKEEDAGDNGKGSKGKVPEGKKPEEPHAEQKQSDKHDIKGEQPGHASWNSFKVAHVFSAQQAAHQPMRRGATLSSRRCGCCRQVLHALLHSKHGLSAHHMPTSHLHTGVGHLGASLSMNGRPVVAE